MRKKKRFMPVLCLMILLCVLTGCRQQDPCIPEHYISSEEHWDKNGFQDHTDYCIYRYGSGDALKACPDYSTVTENDIERIAGYFTDLEGWMTAKDRSDEYGFDRSVITAGDRFLIKTKEGQPIGGSFYGPYDHYTVYFFDTDTFTLYYIHSNI